jgi:hypothetical protein
MTADYLQLQRLLSGNSTDWDSLPNKNFLNFLSKFLLPNGNYEELLQTLKRIGPRQVCQYQFRPNDIVWICRQCQKVSSFCAVLFRYLTRSAMII